MGQEPVTLDIACVTSAGGRPVNQDFAGYEKAGRVYCLAVADGVGGCRFGEFAARQAVQSLRDSFRGEPVAEPAVLRRHMEEAARSVSSLARNTPALKTMRTTLSAVYLDDTRIAAGYAGDSRIYIFRSGRIAYCSQDHSLVMGMALRGELRMEEIRGHPKRNVITSALGSTLPSLLDTVGLDFPLSGGDGILLCSDGFWELVLENEMRTSLAASATAQQWLQGMERLVGNRQAGHSDNYTCLAALAQR